MSHPSDSSPSRPAADVCVIGSGAMGIALAVKLAKAGKSVLIVEAGGTEISESSQKFYECQSIGRPHPGSTDSRFRVFGGSTERWGGQAMRFNPIDVSRRPWMNAREWPVPYDEIYRYYPEAEAFLGLEDPPYEGISSEIDSLSSKLALPPRPFGTESSPFMLHASVFMKQPRLREMYAKDLRHPNVTVVREAAAVRLETDGSGTVTGVVVRTPDQDRLLTAGQYVLAAGGIENARFLLIQRDLHAVPELAEHDAIGRYFQDHPGVHVAEVTGRGAALFQNAFRMKSTPSMFIKGRITWSESFRRNHELVSVSGTFLMSRRPTSFDIDLPASATRRGNASEWVSSLACLARGIMYSPLHHTVLAVSAEDVPDEDSRITLSRDRTDPHGLPAAVVDWRVSRMVADSIIRFADSFEQAYRDARWGEIRRFSFTRDVEALIPHLKDNAHHIGSTSMGSTAKEGVIDGDAKVFGFSNFHVAGTSALPTGSHANPTLTALALCLRLADKLKVVC
ncbi:MAG TPA: GMC family oxidoreductase [Luteolibacter sp.]